MFAPPTLLFFKEDDHLQVDLVVDRAKHESPSVDLSFQKTQGSITHPHSTITHHKGITCNCFFFFSFSIFWSLLFLYYSSRMGSHHQHHAFFLVFGILLAASILTSQDRHYCTSNLWQIHKVLYRSSSTSMQFCCTWSLLFKSSCVENMDDDTWCCCGSHNKTQKKKKNNYDNGNATKMRRISRFALWFGVSIGSKYSHGKQINFYFW